MDLHQNLKLLLFFFFSHNCRWTLLSKQLYSRIYEWFTTGPICCYSWDHRIGLLFCFETVINVFVHFAIKHNPEAHRDYIMALRQNVPHSTSNLAFPFRVKWAKWFALKFTYILFIYCHIALYCIVLHCIVLYCIALYCIVFILLFLFYFSLLRAHPGIWRFPG